MRLHWAEVSLPGSNIQQIDFFLCAIQKRFYICTPLEDKPSKPIYGGLAQLARALRWQRRGHRFESVILHQKTFHLEGLFLCPTF
jgi:hypothetical protein